MRKRKNAVKLERRRWWPPAAEALHPFLSLFPPLFHSPIKQLNKQIPNSKFQIPNSKFEVSNPKNPSIITVTWNLKWSAAQSQREREKIKREEREREKKRGFLLFSPPPPGPPHCCFFCSILFAPSPLSERLEQAICYGTLFSLLENVATNYYQYALGLERNIPKNALKIYPEIPSFFP